MVTKSWQNNGKICLVILSILDQLGSSTNPIEGLHRQIRKFTKTKGSFTNTNALYKQVYCAIKKVEQKWTTALPNCALTMSQLDIFFPNRLKIELN
ncbi:transposase [Wolbachia endosymbiont of Encarsia formosa]|uniref:transposase n=1 Tax=Wolbachia endosymbiont of Encarsia formosa TaxID=77125 RepID=UPI00397E8521